ncbi:MAG: septation protein IspZ, partial [Pseudomonadota bacterium]
INLFFAQQYITAQNALISAVPTVNADQLAELDCVSQFSEEHQPLCQEASDREKTWVTVKVFGLMALTILFIIAQSLYLMRHMKEPEEDDAEPSGTS